MSSTDLIPSIDRAAGSSVGALLTPFMRCLIQSPSFREPATETVDLGWCHDLAGGGRINHWLSYEPRTEFAPQYPQALLLRFLCHYLVDSVPDDGVSELAEATLSVFDYYRIPRKSVVVAPEHRQLVAEMGRTFESPGFRVEDE